MIMERVFRKIWYDEGKDSAWTLPVLTLAPFSLLYGLIISARNKRFDLKRFAPARLPCRVISVGNLTVGGTGKTPTVIYLARMLKDQGYRPVVLSRGYGGTSKHAVNVVSRGDEPLMKQDAVGDEPFLMAKSLTGVPVLTGTRRVLTGDWALKNLHADVLILDDGFQHRQLARDIDIVLLHAANPFGNGRLLPAGPLREPISALKRADIIIETGTYDDLAAHTSIALPVDVRTPAFRCYYKPRSLLRGGRDTVFPLEIIKGKKICAFAGIGNPGTFKKTLAALGAALAVFIAFPDHHRYTRADVSLISERARQCGAEMIVTTEKDRIKMEAFDIFLNGVYALRIEMDFLSAREDFEKLILEKFKNP